MMTAKIKSNHLQL